MSIDLRIPDDLEAALLRQAASAGRSAPQFALDALRRGLDAYEQDDRLSAVRQAFAASGLTEDEAVDLFETEKHQARDERRSAG